MSKKSTGKHKQSSGASHISRVGRAVRRLEVKKKRWLRYQAEIKAGTRKRKPGSRTWNVSGLEKEITRLGKLRCLGPKQR